MAGGLIVACNKSSSSGSSSSGTSTTQVQTQSSDETQVSNEMDASGNDVTASLSSQSSINGDAIAGNTRGITLDGAGDGSITSNNLICDASVVHYRNPFRRHPYRHLRMGHEPLWQLF